MQTEQSKLKRPSVFDYQDYVSYFKDHHRYLRCTTHPRLSLRKLSLEIGMKSQSHLSLILAKKRNLHEKFASRISEIFGHSPEEANYFLKLVLFSGVARTSEIDEELARAARENYKGPTPVEVDRNTLLRKWYFIPLLEMIEHKGFKPTREWIKEHALLPLPAEETISGLNFLIEQGFIIKSDGVLKKSDRLLYGGTKLDKELITKYHALQAQLSSRMISVLPLQQREANSTTLSIGSERFEELKQRIAEFQMQILQDFGTEDAGDQVVQLNIQMFPVTK